jgi:hypothetical protein
VPELGVGGRAECRGHLPFTPLVRAKVWWRQPALMTP